jgi:hypothetical protein
MIRNLFAAIACCLLLAVYAVTSWTAWRSKGITFDEPLHLVAATLQTRQGNFHVDQENPPFWKDYFIFGNPAGRMQLPSPTGDLSNVSLFQSYAIQTVYQSPANNAQELVNSARARMLPLAILLGAIIAIWSFKLAGPLAAFVSIAAFCLDPNFLAHGPLVKNDVPIALLFTALMFALWRVGRMATPLNSSALALLLGATLTTKFSGLLAIPLVPATLLLRALLPADWRILRFTAATFPRRLLVAATLSLFAFLISYIFIWASYDFRFHPSPGPDRDLDYAIRSYSMAQTISYHGPAFYDASPEEFQKWLTQWQPDRLTQIVKWTHAHHLLPSPYLCGFLYANADTFGCASFLLGRTGLTGWWYYFPLTITFKTPLATLIALALAALACFFLPRSGDPWPLATLTLAPILFMPTAMYSRMDVGIRHILTVYPFLYILLGIAAHRAFQKFGKPVLLVLSILLLGLAVETFAAFPDYIPFFNVAAGGSRGGARLLSDSNIDWGQELPDLAKWQANHTDYQLMLSYFGAADPRYYGIRYARLPGSLIPNDQTKPTGQKPYWAISIVALDGQYLNSKGRDFYEPFRDRQPTQILGGCIYLYAPW